MGVITETWLSDGESLDADIEGLCLGANLGMLCLNRPTNDRGFSHGGVAIVWKASDLTLRQVKLHNPHGYEVSVSYTHLTLPTNREV